MHMVFYRMLRSYIPDPGQVYEQRSLCVSQFTLIYVLIVGMGTQTQKKIAFTVKLGSNVHSGLDDTLVFTSVVTNNGSAYSTTTGKFTCSQGGVYVFSTTLISYDCFLVSGSIITTDHAELILVFNQQPSTPPCQAGLSSCENCHIYGQYPSASGQGLIRLVVGDQVWVQGFADRVSSGSSFTGFLLYSN
jgi:hypothetical protein